MEKKSEIINVQSFPYTAGFNWSVGFMMERFIRTLAERKLLGSQCQECKYTYVPPRCRCGKCYARMDENNLISISDTGTVIGYTVAHVGLDGAGNYVDLEDPRVIAAVRLDAADSLLFLPVEGLSPEEVTIGMRVELQWREETKGELADIRCVRPAG